MDQYYQIMDLNSREAKMRDALETGVEAHKRGARGSKIRLSPLSSSILLGHWGTSLHNS
jgi:hypothetical protein